MPLSASASTASGETGSLLWVIDVFEGGSEMFVDGVGIVVVDGVTEGFELGRQQLGEGKLERQMPFGQVEHLVEEVVQLVLG